MLENQIRTSSPQLEPSFRLINRQGNRSFTYKYEPFNLSTRWHYHPEVELIFFIKGNTSCIVGQEFTDFEEGEVVILGSNLPHVLQENSEFASLYPDVKPFGLIVQFRPDFLGENFFNVPELEFVNRFLERSKRGVRFGASVSEKFSAMPNRMEAMRDHEKLLQLLTVLLELAESEDYELLTKENLGNAFHVDEDRMLRVNEYIYRRFTDHITIREVASLINMSESAFCRYFRSRTLKTFTRYLNEIRISYACKLMQNASCSISSACFESGFNSLSYFNRQFRVILGSSPNDYRKAVRRMKNVT